MSVLNHGEEPRTGGMGKVLVIGIAVILLGAAVYLGLTLLWMKQPARPEPAPASSRPIARPGSKPVQPSASADEPKPEPRSRIRSEKPAAPTPAPAEPTGPVLVVESDVPGASVFVDRKYLGTTPLRTTDITAGAHQLNASATGEDGLVQNIDVVGTGETAVALKFREIRLDVRVAAVHKHGLGSCSGTVSATPAGIRYETDNKKDAFFFPLSELEVFEIDYLKKELKVKQRGGRTWNFTDKNENADKLFVFHRDVSKARDRLAAQVK